MKQAYFSFLFFIFFFTGCTQNIMPPQENDKREKSFKSKSESETKCRCSIEDINRQLSKEQKRLLYKNIKNDINRLIDEGDTYFAKTYYLKALHTYDLINFYNDKELISQKRLDKLQARIDANGKYYYEKAIKTKNDKLKKLFYLNELMRNKPDYKDGKVIYDKLRKDEELKRLLQKDKQRLSLLLLNGSSNEEKYLLQLNNTIDKLASYDDLEPLVVQGKELLNKKRYLLRDIAVNLYEQKKFVLAKEKFEFIQQLYEKDTLCSFYLAQMDRNKELKEMESKAITALQSADYKKAVNIANDILAFNDQNIQALSIIKKANRELRRQIPIMIKKATLYYHNQDYNKALSIFQEVLSLDSVNNTALTYTKKIKAQLKTIQSLKQ